MTATNHITTIASLIGKLSEAIKDIHSNDVTAAALLIEDVEFACKDISKALYNVPEKVTRKSHPQYWTPGTQKHLSDEGYVYLESLFTKGLNANQVTKVFEIQYGIALNHYRSWSAKINSGANGIFV